MEFLKRAVDWIFGETNEQRLRRLQPIVDEINRLEPEIQKLSDDQLRAKTEEFRDRIAHGETLDDILPRRSPSYARPPDALSGCVPSTSNSWAGSSSIKLRSPK